MTQVKKVQIQRFSDDATASTHRGFCSFSLKHNILHQSKLGTDVELLNTPIVVFESPRDVHQDATLTVELGLGSTLVDWYWLATSVLCGHFLTELSPRTNNRLRYC